MTLSRRELKLKLQLDADFRIRSMITGTIRDSTFAPIALSARVLDRWGSLCNTTVQRATSERIGRDQSCTEPVPP